MSSENTHRAETLDFNIFPEDEQSPEFTMLGLHGRNANKYAFFPFVRQMGFLHTQWILPSATYATEQSEDIRHWFNHISHDKDEVAYSRRLITDIIDNTIRFGVLPENIFLVGFSQGCTMSIDTALRYPERLGGIVALSGYVVHPEMLEKERSAANQSIPIFWGHGEEDDIIDVKRGRENAGILANMGYNVEYHEYPTTHRIASEEVKDIRAFLHRHMYGMTQEESQRHSKPVIPF